MADYKHMYHIMLHAAENAITDIENANYGEARKKLIEAQIYCPVHWPKGSSITSQSATAYRLSHANLLGIKTRPCKNLASFNAKLIPLFVKAVITISEAMRKNFVVEF